MYKILVLLLVILPFNLSSTAIEIIADVNGNPISNLDIDKRIKLISSLFGNYQKEQILEDLINEIIIADETEKLKIQIKDEELNNTVRLFFVYSFGLKNEEVDKYINEHNIDFNALAKKIKYDLLLHKMNAMMHPTSKVSDEELENVRKQMEQPDYLISLQEIVMPEEKKNIMYNLVKKWRDDSNFIPDPPVKIHKTILNLNKLIDKMRNILVKLEIGDITDPICINKDHCSIIKIVDKVRVDYGLLNSTLSLKQVTVQDSAINLNKITCANFDDIAKPEEIKEFKIKMKDLNADLQVVFSKGNINEIARIQNGNIVKLIMLCHIESNPTNIETLKSLIYGQNLIAQSSILLDNMRKHAVINYRNKKSVRV
ncbi:hypothetical protein BIY23_00445 [Wolbachia pipientis]|uniref:peptidylprolyl isomerase n=1 Tax=Wolbachia pipientis TaxID=955 RepID=A0A1E7QL67_WOLPI|nr:SurA N-terminal domain-containing protein [Wolbachia pipientis]OEY86959.1 hypothetical protein BIY23_00445 [Wolbachia pipientis]